MHRFFAIKLTAYKRKVNHILDTKCESAVNFPPDLSYGLLPSESGPDLRRAIADLVRSFVHARRGCSRFAAVEWVAQFLDPETKSGIHPTIATVVEAMCEVNDIGSGQMRGEPVLFALPERRVALPDGNVIVLGDHGILDSRGASLLFPTVEGSAGINLIDLLDMGDNKVPKGMPLIRSEGRWPEGKDMPSVVRRALILCSGFDPATSAWSMSEENAAFLNEWFRSGQEDEPEAGPTDADGDQQLIIAGGADRRVVVEAGPGTGKTYVACERVKKLVTDDGIAPSRILMLSFTRLAVAELRRRIEAGISDTPGLASLQIFTFDSFAARVNSAYGKNVSGTYEGGIRNATRVLSSGDFLVADTLSQIEHLIIDEAQDLVGDRKDLCQALLKTLNQTCGVTVFGDFAQSIYDYQATSGSPQNFLSEVAERPDFQSQTLSSDHRTKTVLLKAMFRSVRQTLRFGGTRDAYFEVREKIRAGASENDISDFSSHASTTSGLILTRSRAGLNAAAEAMRARGRRFRIHLPDRPLRVEPWIGAVLGGVPASQLVSRAMFGALYDDVYPSCARPEDECWEILKDLDGASRDTITVGRVAEALEEPPVELISKYEGDSGPLLSTIHGQKGAEDQRVLLLMTRAPAKDETNWGEEARILYVGATRAVRELRTGWINPARLYRNGTPERHWAPRADHWLTEVGLEGDLLPWSVFQQAGCVGDTKKTIAAIWSASAAKTSAEAITDSKGNLILYSSGEKIPLGCFSEGFGSFIQRMRRADPDATLPARISGFNFSGATTVVVPGIRSEMPGLSLMPLLGGFAHVAR